MLSKPGKRLETPELPLLPLKFKKDGTLDKFSAHFNGFSVLLEVNEKNLFTYEHGSFGKGSLSRSYPSTKKLPILRQRQEVYRKQIVLSKEQPAKVLIVPDSDDENEAYFTNLRVNYSIDASGIQETLNLMLEEAFFLMHDLQCLNLYYGENLLSVADAFREFTVADEYFLQNYIVYHYYRSKNWIVKPGIKFGVDFVLYKDGPKYSHSTYTVIIDNLDSNLERRTDINRRSMKLLELLGLNRLSETVGKKLLICQIIWPDGYDHSRISSTLSEFSVKELEMKRWLPFKDC